MSTAFTDSLHHVLLSLRFRGGKRGNATYPAEVAGQDIRVRAGEPSVDWFRRCVRDYLGGDVGRCRVEDNLGLFLQIEWGNGQLRAARCQTFAVLDGFLQDVYVGEPLAVRYLRFDYDRDEAGDLFSHPFPHVHSQPDDAPRFPLTPTDPRLSLIEFFEFLYLNFGHRAWLAWARRVAKDRATILDQLLGLLQSSQTADSKREAIRKFVTAKRGEIGQIIGLLREAKREMPFALPLDLGGFDVLNYFG